MSSNNGNNSNSSTSFNRSTGHRGGNRSPNHSMANTERTVLENYIRSRSSSTQPVPGNNIRMQWHAYIERLRELALSRIQVARREYIPPQSRFQSNPETPESMMTFPSGIRETRNLHRSGTSETTIARDYGNNNPRVTDDMEYEAGIESHGDNDEEEHEEEEEEDHSINSGGPYLVRRNGFLISSRPTDDSPSYSRDASSSSINRSNTSSSTVTDGDQIKWYPSPSESETETPLSSSNRSMSRFRDQDKRSRLFEQMLVLHRKSRSAKKIRSAATKDLTSHILKRQKVLRLSSINFDWLK